MARQATPESDKRVPIALALMGIVLALIGLQQPRGEVPAQATLALASSASR